MDDYSKAMDSSPNEPSGSAPRPFVVVSGLPASGKTTLGAEIARALGLPLIDKDDILEELFEAHDRVDVALRQQLSRKADAIFQARAEASRGAVLVSFWRPLGDAGSAGTPSDWTTLLSSRLVEVHCECPAGLAEHRFRARTRHPAHNDTARLDALAQQFADLSARGHLGIGDVIKVRTDKPIATDEILANLQSLLG